MPDSITTQLGANSQILDRLEAVGELDRETRARFDEALGSGDNHTRALKSIELMTDLWRSDRALGAPPFLDAVYDDEQDHSYYAGYRDHVVHSLQVYILGLDIYHHQPSLQSLLAPSGDEARFRRQWMIASLAHDHGYVAEVSGRVEIPARVQERLENPLVAFSDVIADGAQLRLRQHTLRRQPAARFFEELHDFEGRSLLDAVATQASAASLGTGENPLRDYYDFAREHGWGGRDHGLTSVLLLLQMHHRLQAQVDGIEWAEIQPEMLTVAERAFLEQLPVLLRSAQEDLLAACAAIGVHNVRRDVWTEQQLTLSASQFRLRLSDFRISLRAFPLAWFLAFCDSLQCWNRPLARGGHAAVDGFYPASMIDVDHSEDQVVLTFQDEEKYIRTTGGSRFYQLRLELVDYLDEGAVDALLVRGSTSSLLGETPTAGTVMPKAKPPARSHGANKPMRNWSVPGPITPDLPEDEIDRRLGRGQFHEAPPVCVLYTGGSVGMVHKDPTDEKSPLVTSEVRYIPEYLQRLNDLQFDIHFWELPDPLDSSNIQPSDWHRIASIIQKLYPRYQGFVILHGTDTMTYTASALSFLFPRDLSKPILLTGAERPIAQLLTDGVANIMNALQLAAPQTVGKPLVPEVCIYFGGKLIRGNRAKKTHSLAFAGFDSPNCELLGTVEDKIDIHTAVVRPLPESYGRNSRVQLTVDRLDERVAIFEIYPSTEPCLDLLEHMLTRSDKVRAVVLKTYGTGNAPTLPDRFLHLIEEGVKEHERIIVNLTSCPAGQVEVRLFETNARLFELGVINGGDMTAEAAATKLMWLLAKHARRQDDEIDREAIVRDMQVDQRGELRYSVYNLIEKGISLSDIDAYTPASRYIGEIEPSHIDHAYLRVHGIKVESQAAQEFDLALYFQSPQLTAATAERFSDHRVGLVARQWEGTESQRRDGITFNLDATHVVRQHLQTGEHLSIQVLPKSIAPIKIETLELAIFTENRPRFA